MLTQSAKTNITDSLVDLALVKDQPDVRGNPFAIRLDYVKTS